MFLLQRTNSLFKSPSILPLMDKIEALMKLKPPTNIKEVRHFLGLTIYYRNIICNYSEIAPLKLLDKKSPSLSLEPQTSNLVLTCYTCNSLNMPIVQLSDPNQPYLLVMDMSKYSYSGVLRQASMDESNEALLKLLTDKDLVTNVESQTLDLKLNSNLVHRWPTITKECFSVFMSIKKC